MTAVMMTTTATGTALLLFLSRTVHAPGGHRARIRVNERRSRDCVLFPPRLYMCIYMYIMCIYIYVYTYICVYNILSLTATPNASTRSTWILGADCRRRWARTGGSPTRRPITTPDSPRRFPSPTRHLAPPRRRARPVMAGKAASRSRPSDSDLARSVSAPSSLRRHCASLVLSRCYYCRRRVVLLLSSLMRERERERERKRGSRFFPFPDDAGGWNHSRCETVSCFLTNYSASDKKVGKSKRPFFLFICSRITQQPRRYSSPIDVFIFVRSFFFAARKNLESRCSFYGSKFAGYVIVVRTFAYLSRAKRWRRRDEFIFARERSRFHGRSPR